MEPIFGVAIQTPRSNCCPFTTCGSSLINIFFIGICHLPTRSHIIFIVHKPLTQLNHILKNYFNTKKKTIKNKIYQHIIKIQLCIQSKNTLNHLMVKIISNLPYILTITT